MSFVGNVRTVQRSRKAKRCDWCDETIEVGQPAVTYLWKDGADTSPTRLHPECYRASGRLASEEGCEVNWTPGDFSRGCTCPRGECKCAKVKQ